MAIVLFSKDGEKMVVNEYGFEHYLEAGWLLTKVSHAVPVEEPDEEIRLRAKEAGIKNWHNRKIDTLKEMLGS